MSDNFSNLCGLKQWRPKFLQRFANHRSFIVVFGLLGTIQAMAFIYFVATLTTLEKRFQLPSETMGILMSGNEISQILLVLLLSYLGGQGNRPLWIAWGVAISALSCYILASPHFILGAGDTALSLTKEYRNPNVLLNVTNDKKFICSTENAAPDCTKLESQNFIPMMLVFLSQFVLGIGTSLYFSLGQTYMDDNTKKTKTPMLLGITMSLRTLGPALGFTLGFLCLNLYIDPSLTPLIDKKDPRWMGAWWLGWVILGSAMIVFAIFLSMFPKDLPKPVRITLQTIDRAVNTQQEFNYLMVKRKKNQNDPKTLAESTKKRDKKVSIRLFFSSLLRIFKNPLLMINNFVGVFYILSASGYMNFFNKYNETLFTTGSAKSNLIAAVTTIFSLVLGFLGSGYIITRFRPRTKFLLLWNICIASIYVAGEIVIMNLSCDNGSLQGAITDDGTKIFNPLTECNAECNCEFVKYAPVCNLQTEETFFSACHAGCTSMFPDMSTFTNCSCVDRQDILKQGPCPVDCSSKFYLFIGVICVMQMIGCTGRITNVLINYRSVKLSDKVLAQGVSLFLISLFAFIPGPIIFGKIIDRTCLVWDNSCGNRGNCWVYDKDAFRISLNATAVFFSACALVLDIALFFLGGNLDLYREDE